VTSHINNDQLNKRRDRSGMSIVEFTLLLPFLAVMAASLFSLGYLAYRSIGQSYSAFSAARRCAISGKAVAAGKQVRIDYHAFTMPGTPSVSAVFTPGYPGRCQVTVRDRFTSLAPDEKGRLHMQERPGAVVTVTAAGMVPILGGDNDL
jgi:Flp pilus assembly protein TadG